MDDLFFGPAAMVAETAMKLGKVKQIKRLTEPVIVRKPSSNSSTRSHQPQFPSIQREGGAQREYRVDQRQESHSDRRQNNLGGDRRQENCGDQRQDSRGGRRQDGRGDYRQDSRGGDHRSRGEGRGRGRGRGRGGGGRGGGQRNWHDQKPKEQDHHRQEQ